MICVGLDGPWNIHAYFAGLATEVFGYVAHLQLALHKMDKTYIDCSLGQLACMHSYWVHREDNCTADNELEISWQYSDQEVFFHSHKAAKRINYIEGYYLSWK